MDPKLRPSFADIVKTLEEMLNRLRNEESERDRKFLNLDNNERKSKGECLYRTNTATGEKKKALYFESWYFGYIWFYLWFINNFI